MSDQFLRTELLIGKECIEKLSKAKVIVYGVGGVGSFVVEGLVRAGVGHLIIVDYDKYDITNINRQIGAMHSTIGKYKIDVMKERVLDINPNIKIEAYRPDEIKDGETSLIDLVISALILFISCLVLFKYGIRVYKVGILNYTSKDLWKKVFQSLKIKENV